MHFCARAAAQKDTARFFASDVQIWTVRDQRDTNRLFFHSTVYLSGRDAVAKHYEKTKNKIAATFANQNKQQDLFCLDESKQTEGKKMLNVKP